MPRHAAKSAPGCTGFPDGQPAQGSQDSWDDKRRVPEISLQKIIGSLRNGEMHHHTDRLRVEMIDAGIKKEELTGFIRGIHPHGRHERRDDSGQAYGKYARRTVPWCHDEQNVLCCKTRTAAENPCIHRHQRYTWTEVP